VTRDWFGPPRSIKRIRDDAQAKLVWRKLMEIICLAHDILDYEANPKAMTKLGLEKLHRDMVQGVAANYGIPQTAFVSPKIYDDLAEQMGVSKKQAKVMTFAQAYGAGAATLARMAKLAKTPMLPLETVKYAEADARLTLEVIKQRPVSAHSYGIAMDVDIGTGRGKVDGE
jgi:hypothetical protein